MLLTGGYTTYGQDIGILMLDTRFPRIPGDIGNARTYRGLPVRYKVVKDAVASKIMGDAPEAELLMPFIEAARELEAEGVKAITTSCGFLAAFQRELAAAVSIPVFTSALILVPLIRAMLGQKQEIGVFTERAQNMNENHFLGAGWSRQNIPVCISGMPEGSPFPALFIDGGWQEEREVLEDCMVELTERHMNMYPDTGAIVLECTNFGPYSRRVQEIAQVPVFGINQLLEYMASVVNIRSYY